MPSSSSYTYKVTKYTATGEQDTFTVPFDYLQKDFVKVALNNDTDNPLVYGTDYTISNDRTLTLTDKPVSGTIVTVYRETPFDRLVKWNEGSILTARNMSTQQIQELHILEEMRSELYDNALSLLTLDSGEQVWNAKDLRIVSLADPIDDNDVINLKYLKSSEKELLTKIDVQTQEGIKNLDDRLTSVREWLERANETIRKLENDNITYIPDSTIEEIVDGVWNGKAVYPNIPDWNDIEPIPDEDIEDISDDDILAITRGDTE